MISGLFFLFASIGPSIGAPIAPAPAERGICLGLFSADPEFRYRGLLEEIRAHGATHVSVAWVWWQKGVTSNELGALPGWSATSDQIRDTIAYAKALDLEVTAFPILRLSEPGRGQWRGMIAPTDEDLWWASYQRFILDAAALASTSGAARIAVGSELVSRERMRGRWLELIDRVRVAAPSLEILYSANWDHFGPVSFWDAVDVMGVTGYFELTQDLDAPVPALASAWGPIRAEVLQLARRTGKPLVLAEVGYPSLDGGAVWPWDETRKAPVDLEEQRRAYEALVVAWRKTPELRGVYFWNWFGFGGPEDTGYSPRMKPAAEVIRRWFTRPEDLGR